MSPKEALRSLGTGLLRPVLPIWRAIELWNAAGGTRMSAAISFYGVLSLAPLLLVMVALLGWWMDRQMLQHTLVAQIGALVGPQGAAAVQQALSSTREPAQGVLATLAGFVVLLFGATGVFGELQEAFARVWAEGGPAPKPAWWHSASLRLRGVAYILAFGFLLLVSLVISTVLSIFSGWAGDYLALEVLLRVLNEAVSLGLCAALFVALMRLSGGRKPGLRYLVLGGVLGAVLFAVGRQVLTMYLARAAVVSAYGAAGSLVVLLFWIYFSAGVVLLAAAVAKAAEEAHLARLARQQAWRRSGTGPAREQWGAASGAPR